MPVLLISLLFLALTGFLLWLVRSHRFGFSGWLAAVPPLIVTIWQLTQLGPVSQGIYRTEIYAWAPQIGLDLSFRLDGLALFFGLIVTGIGAGVALYTAYYFEKEPRQGYFYLLLFAFMASMLGVVWSDSLLTLFVFWEGTSIASYLLIAFKYYDAAGKEGGRRAFIVTGLGGLAMLAGILLLGIEADTFRISEILASPGLIDGPLFPAALVLILLGAFTKSAQFPFHFWLPGAMAAPTPASAYLHSATMVKAGIYLLARMHPAMSDSPLWFWSLLIFGGITMLLGAVSSLRYYDLKALLANATLGQLGLLVMLLAFSSDYAYMAVVVGILAHALYKGPLFLVAGIIDHATGTRDMRRLTRLWRQMPWTTTTGTLAALSMAGIPPTFGFLAKELMLESYYGVFEYGETLIGGVALAAGITTGTFFVAAALTLVWGTFFGPKPDKRLTADVHHAPSFGFDFAPLVLVLIGTAIPFALPALERLLFAPAADSIAGAHVEVHLKLWHGFTPVLLMSVSAIIAGVVVFLLRRPLRSLLRATPQWLNGVYVFNRINDGVYAFANFTTRWVQGGTMSQQAGTILASASLIVVVSLLVNFSGQSVSVIWTAPPDLPEALIALLAIIAAFATARAQSRLGGIISLGVVGLTVTLFFIFYSAPDLALTQLLIEVLTLVLLVLVFYRVRQDRLPPVPRWRQIRNLVVAVAMGIFGFTLVILSNTVQVGESISRYFLENSVSLGKGGNVVNVILVDFRGYDTMGEITVLGIAALGGYALLRAPRLQTLRARLNARRLVEEGATDAAEESAVPDAENGAAGNAATGHGEATTS